MKCYEYECGRGREATQERRAGAGFVVPLCSEHAAAGGLDIEEIQSLLLQGFTSADDYLSFREAGVSASEWELANGVRVISEAAFDEAVAQIDCDFANTARARIEEDLRGQEFDPLGDYLGWFRTASRDQLEQIAGRSYEEAADMELPTWS